jgi:hypothetical protein
MNYSNLHRVFASKLYDNYYDNEQYVLENPEKYLGPNYKEVLNFWFYKESLSVEKRLTYSGGKNKLSKQSLIVAIDRSYELASEVIPKKCAIYLCEPSCEIVAAHLYIEQGIPFTFLPLLFEL